MIRLILILWLLVVGIFLASRAEAYDRIASVGESPFAAEPDATGGHGILIDMIRAMDRATHSSTKILIRPFARSLKETAAGRADFHIPLIQNEGTPPPEGLAYVMEVKIGIVPFVIYSRKLAPLDAGAVVEAKNIETEPGHESFFPFQVTATHCVPCTLDKILLGRTDALIVPSTIVDPLLGNARYKGIHRALYKMYPARALVPIHADSTATRHYLIDGLRRIQESGEMAKITGHDILNPYSDWQP